MVRNGRPSNPMAINQCRRTLQSLAVPLEVLVEFYISIADGTSTLAGSVPTGVGSGNMGVTITDDGVISVDGTLTVTGSVSIGGNPM